MSVRTLPATDPGQDEHPPVQQLGAYHRSALSAAEEGEIRDHFLICRPCRELMLELAEFLDGTPEPARFSSQDLIAAWQEIQNAKAAVIVS